MLIDYVYLMEKISKANRIVLYGCGAVSRHIKGILLHNKIPIYCAIVTSIDETVNSFTGVAVYELDKVDKDIFPTAFILIAVKDNVTAKTIGKCLVERGATNFSYMTEFQVFNDFLLHRYESLRRAETEEYFTKWATIENKLYVNPIESVTDGIHASYDFAFVILCVTPRVLKILTALRDKGYNVICYIWRDSSYNARVLNDIKNNATEVFDFSSLAGLVLSLLHIDASYVYLFASFRTKMLGISVTIISLRQNMPTLIFEEYDAAYMMWCVDEYCVSMEEYCLRNADFVVDRGFMYDYFFEHSLLEERYRDKVIRIFDGCGENDSLLPVDRKDPTIDDEEMTFCYVGFLAPSNIPPSNPSDGYEFWKKIADMCRDNHCHIHIYVSESCYGEAGFAGRYDKYLDMTVTNKYFHLHPPVSYRKLHSEIAGYDYGISFSGDIKRYKKEYGGAFKYENMIYGGGNKIFDYLDAGLPVLGNMPQRLLKMLEEKGVVFFQDIEELNFDEARRKKYNLKQSVSQVITELRMSEQIEKLLVGIGEERKGGIECI